MIFNIQKCSIHDGNGLRTLVFFKGCPLRCKWCANPESQSFGEDIMESPIKCVGCGFCRTVCKNNAIRDDGSIDRSICNNCNECTDICYAEAKQIKGKEYSAEELCKEIEKDKPFYSIYGGGVTFSGGEPLSQGKLLKDVASLCQKKGINVVVESCGYEKFENFKEALPYIDSMFMDVKHIDSNIHKELTGAGNELILENIRRITDFGIPVTIRTPIIPGLNDSEENIKGIAEFVSSLANVKEYELLPYHNFGESKYNALGRPYELKGMKTPEDEKVRNLVKIANEVLKNYKKECFWTKDNNKEVVK